MIIPFTWLSFSQCPSRPPKSLPCDETVAAQPKETTTMGITEEPEKLGVSGEIRNSEKIMSPA